MRGRFRLPDGEASGNAVTPLDRISTLVRKIGTRKNCLKQFDYLGLITPGRGLTTAYMALPKTPVLFSERG